MFVLKIVPVFSLYTNAVYMYDSVTCFHFSVFIKKSTDIYAKMQLENKCNTLQYILSISSHKKTNVKEYILVPSLEIGQHNYALTST